MNSKKKKKKVLKNDSIVNIRESFKASDGYVLIAADYKQLELRLIASLSGDKALFDMFQK